MKIEGTYWRKSGQSSLPRERTSELRETLKLEKGWERTIWRE
jgi:hypothetical protein